MRAKEWSCAGAGIGFSTLGWDRREQRWVKCRCAKPSTMVGSSNYPTKNLDGALHLVTAVPGDGHERLGVRS